MGVLHECPASKPHFVMGVPLHFRIWEFTNDNGERRSGRLTIPITAAAALLSFSGCFLGSPSNPSAAEQRRSDAIGQGPAAVAQLRTGYENLNHPHFKPHSRASGRRPGAAVPLLA